MQTISAGNEWVYATLCIEGHKCVYMCAVVKYMCQDTYVLSQSIHICVFIWKIYISYFYICILSEGLKSSYTLSIFL